MFWLRKIWAVSPILYSTEPKAEKIWIVTIKIMQTVYVRMV